MTTRGKPLESASEIVTQAVSGGTDFACQHCRERKIKCGRERPRCNNCKKDNANCQYQNPGKRVNHMKLLCNNVDRVEGRLMSVETQISQLVATLERDGLSGSLRSSSSSESELSSTGCPDTRQDPTSSSDRYRGSLSLQAMCSQLSQHYASANISSEPSMLQDHHRALELLNEASDVAKDSHVAVHQAGNGFPRLPPLRYLMKAQTRFFQHADERTNVFLPEHFLANVNRVHGAPTRQIDEPWIVCFNVVVYLALGSELLGTSSDSLFGGLAGSLLFPKSASLVTTRLLIEPRLINVQTLILLSVLAQHHDSQAWSESLFAQACVLAQTLGLYQTSFAALGFDQDEIEECELVLKALYIRDKAFTVLRGSHSWLSEANIRFFGSASILRPTYHDRWLRLAMIQDRIYELAHSSRSRKKTSRKLEAAVTQIRNDLAIMAALDNVFGHNGRGYDESVFQLALISTRIGALYDIPAPSHESLLLLDARVACLILLRSKTPKDVKVQERLEKLCSSNREAFPLPTNEDVGIETDFDSDKTSFTNSHRLLNVFPASAYVYLVRCILLQTKDFDEAERDQDITLLRSVCNCFVECSPSTPTASYIQKVATSFQLLLQAIELVREGKLHQPMISHLIPMPNFQTSSAGSPGSLPSPYEPIDLGATGFSSWATPSSLRDVPMDNWTDMTTSCSDPATLLMPTQQKLTGDVFDGMDTFHLQSEGLWDTILPEELENKRKRPRTGRKDDDVSPL